MSTPNSNSLTPLSLPVLADSAKAHVRVVLGHVELSNGAAPAIGSPIPLEEKLTDPIRIEVDGRVTAWGEAVVLDGKVAVRITGVEREASDDEVST